MQRQLKYWLPRWSNMKFRNAKNSKIQTPCHWTSLKITPEEILILGIQYDISVSPHTCT